MALSNQLDIIYDVASGHSLSSTLSARLDFPSGRALSQTFPALLDFPSGHSLSSSLDLIVVFVSNTISGEDYVGGNIFGTRSSGGLIYGEF